MKIHVLLKKEEIDQNKINERQIAVVLDVLLATSTITSCLSFGAKEIYPVLDKNEGLMLKRKSYEDSILVGEFNGETISGFLDPTPLSLKKHSNNKKIILSTTNGTVAIRNASNAKRVYIASLLNGFAVANNIYQHHFGSDYTIIVICAGSGNNFCLEDFYGAGYFVDQLISMKNTNEIELTDSALSAKLFYQKYQYKSKNILSESRVGKKMMRLGLEDELTFVSQKGLIPIVPQLIDNRIVR